ncbi:unnamed protein product, partial [Closterium sp. Yama58-4]
VAACAALSNQPYLQEVRDALVRERARLMGHLTALPFLKPFPSHANFILCALHNTHWTAKQLKVSSRYACTCHIPYVEVMLGQRVCYRMSWQGGASWCGTTASPTLC